MREIRRDPRSGWERFLDRYGGPMLTWIGSLGFDYDESMDRFVFVCEKLADDRCRRLRSLDHLGENGELEPWLRTVVRNSVISWAWSEQGRSRLPRAIEKLGSLEQEVFRHHYWDELGPAEIRATLHRAGDPRDLGDVFDALELVLSVLSANDRWRLASRIARRRAPIALDALSEPTTGERDPEGDLLFAEQSRRTQAALAALPAGEMLLLQLRFEEDLTYGDIGSILGCDPATARRRLGKTLGKLRSDLVTKGGSE